MSDKEAALNEAHIDQARAAQLELLSGGGSGASAFRVHGLSEPCILKLVEPDCAEYVRARAYREIQFYRELAAHIPLRTPRVLASLAEESGYCALLIAAYEPLRPAAELRTDDVVEVATQLARFHGTYWNRTDQLKTFAWLAKPASPDLTNDVRHAAEIWLVLAQRPQFREILTVSTLRAIESALTDIQAKPGYDSNPAMTLCHGDCHLDNLLRDQDGGLIWADWQEVQIGYGPNDLTFLIQRAEANGANIVRDMVVAAYCKALQSAGIEGIDQRTITAAMNRSERRTRLLYWPNYMSDATTEQMAHHVTRIFSA